MVLANFIKFRLNKSSLFAHSILTTTSFHCFRLYGSILGHFGFFQFVSYIRFVSSFSKDCRLLWDNIKGEYSGEINLASSTLGISQNN